MSNSGQDQDSVFRQVLISLTRPVFAYMRRKGIEELKLCWKDGKPVISGRDKEKTGLKLYSGSDA